MQNSEEIKPTPLNIYQKLLEMQKRVIGLGKDKAAYGYKYVTGDKVLEHFKPLMNELGLLLKQEVLSIENTRQDYATKSGTTSEINSKVMMRFTWVDVATGEKDENLFGANGQNAWDKGVGSALTYGERYFLLKYFHIATDEDDLDNPDLKPENSQIKPPVETKPAEPVTTANPAQKPTNPATDKQKELIKKTINSHLFDSQRNKVLAELDNYSVTRAKQCIDWLMETIKTSK